VSISLQKVKSIDNMKKVIKVIDGIDINEYNSFEEAVTATNKKIQSYKDKLDLINGKKVESYHFSGDFLFFSLDNGIYLTIFPNFNSIEWDVSFVALLINNSC
jgi:hypothetical protein